MGPRFMSALIPQHRTFMAGTWIIENYTNISYNETFELMCRVNKSGHRDLFNRSNVIWHPLQLLQTMARQSNNVGH